MYSEKAQERGEVGKLVIVSIKLTCLNHMIKLNLKMNIKQVTVKSIFLFQEFH